LLFVGALCAPPAGAEPTTVAEAQAELASLQEAASQAEQAYHDIHDKLTLAQADVAATEAAIAAQDATVETLRSRVAQIALTQYQEQGLSTSVTLFASPDAESLLHQAAAAQRIAGQNADLIQRYQVESGALADKKAHLEEVTAEIAADDARLAELQQEAKDKAGQAQAILDRLEAEAARAAAEAAARARAARANVTSPSQPASPPAYVGDGSKASIVVQFGLSKVGGPYVWGGNGPSGFDCSGLTRAAYLQVGLSLPHNAGGQMGYGVPVSTDALLPGDLIFYYSPVSHVAIYIGGGQIVHASTYGVGIVVSNAFMSPVAGARRLV
jgi:cell wall-associated NlpC family hydrolase